MYSRKKKVFAILTMVLLLVSLFGMTVFATETTGDAAGAIEDTWDAAKGQIKQVVNSIHKMQRKLTQMFWAY